MESTRGTLKVRDWLKGLILFVGTPILTIAQQLIPEWTPILTEWIGKSGAIIAQAGLSAFITYMLKNLGTNDVAVAQEIIVEAKQDEIKKQNEPKK